MPGRFPLAVPRAVRLVSAVWLEPKELARRSLRAELASAIRWKNPKPILNRRSLVVPKRASRTIERQLSGSSLRFRARGGATSSGAGSCPEKRRRGGSSAGWHRRQRLAQPMTTVRGGMPSPSIHCRATIRKSRTTCAFARLIRRPCWRNCERFHGRVGTTNCGSGGCLFALMRSCGAVGQASKEPPSAPSRRRGNAGGRLVNTPMSTRPPGCAMPNAGAGAIRFQPKTCLRSVAPWRRCNMTLLSSPGFQASSPTPLSWRRSTHSRWRPASAPFGRGGGRRPWLN